MPRRRTKRVGSCGTRLSVERLCSCLQTLQDQAVGRSKCGPGRCQREKQVRDGLVCRCGRWCRKVPDIYACACAGCCSVFRANAEMLLREIQKAQDQASWLQMRRSFQRQLVPQPAATPSVYMYNRRDST